MFHKINVKCANDSVLKIASTVHDVLFTMISDILKSYLRLSILLIVFITKLSRVHDIELVELQSFYTKI